MMVWLTIAKMMIYMPLMLAWLQSAKKPQIVYCCYLGRRDKDYVHNHSDILATFGHCLVEYAENPPIFQKAMGKYRYILRSSSESEILRMADFILQKP